MVLKRSDSPERTLLLQQLQHGPMTARDTAIELRVCQKTAYRHLKDLHTEQLVHITAWFKDRMSRGNWYPSYALGTGQDALKPPARTQAEQRQVDALRRRQIRQDVLYWYNELAQKRAKRQEKRHGLQARKRDSAPQAPG